jgi:hypothetical protein
MASDAALGSVQGLAQAQLMRISLPNGSRIFVA